MTAPDVRTAAQAEASRIRFRLKGHDYPANRHYKRGFADGAVWGAALVTPTREQIAEALGNAYSSSPYRDAHLRGADAVLALMRGPRAGALNR